MRYADLSKQQLRKLLEEVIEELNKNDAINIPSDRRGAHWLDTRWWKRRRSLGKKYGRLKDEIKKHERNTSNTEQNSDN